MNKFAQIYIKKFNDRLTHNNIYPEELWIEKFIDYGFIVKRIGYFFTSGQGFWYGILSLRLFQILSLTRIIKSKTVANLFSKLIKFVFYNIIKNEDNITNQNKKNKAGYIVIYAQN